MSRKGIQFFFPKRVKHTLVKKDRRDEEERKRESETEDFPVFQKNFLEFIKVNTWKLPNCSIMRICSSK